MQLVKRSIFRHAHLAGTGPQGKTCHDCKHFDSDVEGFRIRYRFCAKVKHLTGRPGAYCRAQAACSYFLDASDATGGKS